MVSKRKSLRLTTGFTLVELSIVLLIIGLLVAGILAGTTMVHQSRLRNVISDVDDYRDAFSAFKEAYLGVPGDLMNASAFWPTTTSGNGDGQVAYAIVDSTNNEALFAWQHLALADLIHGKFSGVSATQEAIPGTNVPKAAIYDQSGFYINYEGWLGNTPRNLIILGAKRTSEYNNTVLLTPTDAKQIDTKIDDGLPGVGYAWAQGGRKTDDSADSTDCLDGTGSASTYKTTVETPECVIAFVVD